MARETRYSFGDGLNWLAAGGWEKDTDAFGGAPISITGNAAACPLFLLPASFSARLCIEPTYRAAAHGGRDERAERGPGN
jgi:hypothetical protein